MWIKELTLPPFCLLLINNQVKGKGVMLSYLLLNWGTKVLWAIMGELVGSRYLYSGKYQSNASQRVPGAAEQ